MYFTSWDANAYLCLLTVFPEEVVKGMIKMVKEMHEDYCLEDSRAYYCNLDIYKLYQDDKYYPSNPIKEFKHKWRWRCPETRRKNLVLCCVASANNCFDLTTYTMEKLPLKNYGEGKSRAGYWNPGEAWSYSINREDYYEDYEENSEDELTMEYDNENTWERYRKQYVADWYNNIHEGRFFLFFKENDIDASDYLDRHRHNLLVSIMETSGHAQIAQDLLTIDGPGIGKPPENHIEHIDDLFP